MMKYKAKDLLPDWYGTIELKPDLDMLKLREKAIKKIIAKDDKSLWLDIVHLSLGLAPVRKSNINGEFIDEFKKADGNFPLTNNERLIKVLSTIVLCYKIEKGDPEINNFICLAIVNSNFFGQY